MSGNKAKNETLQIEDHGISPTLYVHICNDGSVYLLPGDTLRGVWADTSRLKAELVRLQDIEGRLLLSFEEAEADPSSHAEAVCELIDGYELDCEPVDPHPATNGYYKSFVRYVYEAIEVAEMDITGTEDMIKVAEDALIEFDSGTKNHREISTDISRLEKQLEGARNALQRLLDLELEICTEAEGVEQ